MDWQPIETAPKDGTAVLLAYFRHGCLNWACAAEYGTATRGHVHCASYSGWFPLLPLLTCPDRGRKAGRSDLPDGIVSPRDYPPTHWMPLPEPPHSATVSSTASASRNTCSRERKDA